MQEANCIKLPQAEGFGQCATHKYCVHVSHYYNTISFL